MPYYLKALRNLVRTSETQQNPSAIVGKSKRKSSTAMKLTALLFALAFVALTTGK
jgi:hypothetical protein